VIFPQIIAILIVQSAGTAQVFSVKMGKNETKSTLNYNTFCQILLHFSCIYLFLQKINTVEKNAVFYGEYRVMESILVYLQILGLK